MTLVVFLLLSFFLYIFTPTEYSYSFCSFLCIMYIFQSLYFLAKTKLYGKSINFNTLFLLTNFIVVYIYPIFIYPISPYFFTAYSFGLNPDYINKGTSLSHLALSFYMLGAYYSFKMKKKYKMSNLTINKNLLFILNVLLFIFTILNILVYFPQIGLVYGAVIKNDQLTSLTIVIVTLNIILNTSYYKNEITNYKEFIKKLFVQLLLIFIILFSFLIVGIRYIPIQIILIIIYSYIVFIGNIKSKKILIFSILSFLSLAYISQTRNIKNNSNADSFLRLISFNSEENNLINPLFANLEDLIIITRNIYVGIDYVKENGYLYGQSFVPVLFSPVPFLPSAMTAILFNKTPKDVSSQVVITSHTEKSYGKINYLLGSSAIIDIYINLGATGTFIIFYVFGYLVQFLYNNIHNNIYISIIYILLFSSSIFMVRSSLFDDYRTIIWSVLILYILSKNYARVQE